MRCVSQCSTSRHASQLQHGMPNKTSYSFKLNWLPKSGVDNLKKNVCLSLSSGELVCCAEWQLEARWSVCVSAFVLCACAGVCVCMCVFMCVCVCARVLKLCWREQERPPAASEQHGGARADVERQQGQPSRNWFGQTATGAHLMDPADRARRGRREQRGEGQPVSPCSFSGGGLAAAVPDLIPLLALGQCPLAVTTYTKPQFHSNCGCFRHSFPFS